METSEALKLIDRCKQELDAKDVRIIKQLHWVVNLGAPTVTYEMWVTINPHHTIIMRGRSYETIDAQISTERKVRESHAQ